MVKSRQPLVHIVRPDDGMERFGLFKARQRPETTTTGGDRRGD
jgi:hypothetical protein